MKDTPTRPAGRYYGGKWKIAPWVISHMDVPHKIYVEVFGGMCSVLLRKKASTVEVYNEKADEIWNIFRVLRDKDMSTELVRLLRLTPYSRTEWLDCYKMVDIDLYPVEQARRTIVLLAMSHNPSKALKRSSNGWRSSSSGHHKLPSEFLTYTECLSLITTRLKGVMIENYDCYKIMNQHDSFETLFYLDPPYLQSTRSDKRNLYLEEMGTVESHRELAEYVKKLKGYVIISGYDNKYYKEWFEDEGWMVVSKSATTGAAKRGKSKSNEVLWINPRCAGHQRQMNLFK